MERVLKLSQQEASSGRPSEKKSTKKRIYFTTTYNPHLRNLGNRVNKRWDLLQSKKRSKKIFKYPSLIVYRRPKNLKDFLVSSKVKHTTPKKVVGSKPYRKSRCTWCFLIFQVKEFRSESNGYRYKLFHELNCQSSWVIHVITCKPCKKKNPIYR
jgi:hypothetical protein